VGDGVGGDVDAPGVPVLPRQIEEEPVRAADLEQPTGGLEPAQRLDAAGEVALDELPVADVVAVLLPGEVVAGVEPGEVGVAVAGPKDQRAARAAMDLLARVQRGHVPVVPAERALEIHPAVSPSDQRDAAPS